MSLTKAFRRCASSSFDLTRMWRNTERASLEKKPSMILSQDPWVGVKVKVKRPIGCAASQLVVSREIQNRRCSMTTIGMLFRKHSTSIITRCCYERNGCQG